MIWCCFLTSSSHPIQEGFSKEHANSSKKDTWKGQPPLKRWSVYDVLLLWGSWGYEKVLSLDPGKKATPSTLEKRKLFFSQMFPVFGGTLTLSFLLLTCTSSNITQALRKIYEWLSKQMLLNEKVRTACSSLSQYSYVDKKQNNLYIHLLSNTVRKKLFCPKQVRHSIPWLTGR